MTQLLLYAFTLREGVTREHYERWAIETDLPSLRGIPTVSSYRIFRSGSSEDNPGDGSTGQTRYFELVEAKSLAEFEAALASPPINEVAATFMSLATDIEFRILDELTTLDDLQSRDPTPTEKEAE